MSYTFNAATTRVAKARLAGRLGRTRTRWLIVLAALSTALSIGLFLLAFQLTFTFGGISLLLWSLVLWVRRDIGLLVPVPFGDSTRLEAILPAVVVARYRDNLTAAELVEALLTDWEASFLLARYQLPVGAVMAGLAEAPIDPAIWDEAKTMAQAAGLVRMTPASVLVALFDTTPGLTSLLTESKLDPADLAEGAAWTARVAAFNAERRPAYGGIARDWAAGYTPVLNTFGQNLSRNVELAGPRFGIQERTNQVDALVSALGQGTGSVILVGEPGIGKSALLLGLADQLLRGERSGTLAHHQIVALNASLILSSQQSAGDLERMVLTLLGEAAHAGNIILALDEAQLFFGQGTGAVNLSRILLPVLQARSIKLVLAVTPGDWQRLKATNTAMASLLTPIVLTEPIEEEVIRILADRVLLLEQGSALTTYQALREAYRLSGRYYQDEAYPGKAIKLIEAAQSYPDGPYVSAASVQRAVESQFGVKAEGASQAEVDVLLGLEDHIHQRMINQSRAVGVVASALRRARAGVANPKRPVGSFLFLGPTGVGKTELARSLAALYFGAESNMIRLDMSEYQQPADVTRILASAAENPGGLLPKIRQQPFSVVLLDEIEKAHPNLLNLLLQLLDEGNLTDSDNHATSFKDAIIIATSNAGAEEIRQRIEAGEPLETFEKGFIDKLINAGSFKPELLNRFDEIVLFRPLNRTELAQVVGLLIAEINQTLEPQKVSVALTEAATANLVAEGYDPRLGARPMRRMVQRRVEDAVAGRILRGEATAGAAITLDVADLASSAANPAAPQASDETPKSGTLYERPKD